MAEIIKLNDEISVLTSSIDPLSADVVRIQGNNIDYIYDIGACDKALDFINSVSIPKQLIISHFHQDHLENISRLNLDSVKKIYGGEITINKIRQNVSLRTENGEADFQNIDLEVVVYNQEKVVIGETSSGEVIKVFPVPSSHSKGCVGLEAGNIAFLGDATYATGKNGRYVFNTSLLHNTIECLKGLSCEYIYLSHEGYLQNKSHIIEKLSRIYNLRKPGESYIDVTE